ncbi:INO80 complex subunit C-like [Paramacrobiotus metropolitanus]|uniref:INO80 complex subunit C-like n=1 Tax=Paramacrobiotus metropolitanus TaxID=2943436 RepID=UPI002445859A|nr:INO80 complex subunit C-like [Paramacrobiotus metropolitanus]
MDEVESGDSDPNELEGENPEEEEEDLEEEPEPAPVVVTPPAAKKKKKKGTGKSKRKSKKSSAKQTKVAKTSHPSSAQLEGETDDLELSYTDGDGGERSGKKREIPKPTMNIMMHHPFPFKNPDYILKRRAIDEDKSPYRLLKHIIAQEKAEWGDVPSHPSYWTIRAPPRLKPAKRYSDISGLEAKYIDPETKLHYADAEEFEVCRSLTRDLVQSYLRLRGFVDIIG